MFEAPDSNHHVGTHTEHGDECERAGSRRKPEADRQADIDHCEHDRGVEEPSVPIRPRLEISSPLTPQEEEEERDREEERDLQQPANGRDHGLERQHDDDEGDRGHDPECSGERRNAIQQSPHEPVMNARTASAPATKVVTANQRRRFCPTRGA